MFGPKRIACPAGQWTTIIHTSFAQMPKAWSVKLISAGGAPVQGAFVESKSAWVLPTSPQQGTIDGVHTFERGYWNTFYSVRVNPAADATAEVES